MSFFSRKKQQSTAAPPASVTVAQTPSQALAQISNTSNRDLGQPGSLRADSSLAQYVESHPCYQLWNSHIYLSDVKLALCPYSSSSNHNSPWDLKTEITAQILPYHPPIPSNLSSNHLHSNSSSHNLVTNLLLPGPLADLHSFLPASLTSLVSFPPLHPLPLPSLDTDMLYLQMLGPMENYIFSVVSLRNQREMMFTSSQPETTLPVFYKLPDLPQVHGWAMQVPSLGMPWLFGVETPIPIWHHQ